MFENILNLLTGKTNKDVTLRPASLKEYNMFLQGYIKLGGKITHHYGYKFNNSGKYVIACKDFKVPKLYGAQSMVFLIPENIDCEMDTCVRRVIKSQKEFEDVFCGIESKLESIRCYDIGHNIVLFIDNFSMVGGHLSAYKDTLGYNKKRI